MGLEVNQVQTASFRDDLLAQNPGARALPPDLMTPHEDICGVVGSDRVETLPLG